LRTQRSKSPSRASAQAAPGVVAYLPDNKDAAPQQKVAPHVVEARSWVGQRNA
jgi:hypothetical protein